MSDESAIPPNLLRRLMECYTLLADTCAALPGPISLPREMGPGSWGAREAAVTRASEISYEATASRAGQEALKCAALHWLAAQDLIANMMAESIIPDTQPRAYRPEAALLVLLACEDHARDLVRELYGRQ
ncbi:hypothetical protein [Streptomyces sp. URMC 124]|uniref:hypothetical protein n=1 Tax=Streptomyces sp. URMC 124 TaxID=3423405 RepID=UPI003F1C0BF2